MGENNELQHLEDEDVEEVEARELVHLPEDEEEDFPLFVPGHGSVGQILINQDVIARIAGMAVSEIEGVTLGHRFSLADIFPGKEAVKGIQVQQNDTGHYLIVCEVKIAYRTPIQETAQKLQRHVKDSIERMTGLPIHNVDIKIVDIYMEKKEEEE